MFTGCLDTIHKNMTIFPEMIVGAPDQFECDFDTLFLESFGGIMYEWSPASAVSNPQIPNPFLLNNQPTDLQVEITDGNDCSQTLDVIADFVFEPQAPAWVDTSINLGSTIDFNYPLEAYQNFVWIDPNGNECNTCEMSFAPGITGEYQLVISDNLGCYVDTFNYNVVVLHELEFDDFNVFTPNADGINDLFIPEFERAQTSGYEFSIWNRWGKLIWLTNNLSQEWDGTSNQGGSEKQVHEGVYFWTVKVRNLKGEERQFSGYITLLR